MRAAAGVLLVLASLVALPAALASPAKTKPFTPAVLAGTWSGTWDNQTFSTEGTLTIKIAGKSSLAMTVGITGTTFGCPAPPAQTFRMAKGAGANRWSARGFKLSKPTAAFGVFNATYSYPSGKLVASGKDPACAPGLSFTIAGTWSKTALTGTATITLPQDRGGGTATTVITLAKR